MSDGTKISWADFTVLPVWFRAEAEEIAAKTLEEFPREDRQESTETNCGREEND